jgi:prepilin-type N-terminal cleavage/methylation domain-containing protein
MKKGFTLIELLAVIVILAIILAIAVPGISGIINSSKISAFESDAKLVIKSIGYQQLNNASFDPETINENNVKDLLGISDINYSDISVMKKGDNYVITLIGKEKWNGLIACGNYKNMKVVNSTSECSDDLVSPSITILGDNPVSIIAGNIYTDAGATATDDVDGNITNNIIVTSTVNPNKEGTYYVTYTVSDRSNNKMSSTRTVNVIDNEKPTIVFGTNGNSTYLKTASSTITATDQYGTIDSNSLKFLWNTSTTVPKETDFFNVYTNNTAVNLDALVNGSYYLWAMAKDNSGNIAIERTNVFNLDNTKPVIVINGDNQITINRGTTYSDLGATVTDNIDTTLTVIVTGTVNPNAVGTYTITYNATDSSGNIADSVVRTINVIDANAPIITVLGTNPISITAGTTYIDAGATALDDVDGDISSNITVTSNVNPNMSGSYIVTYTVKDTSNNSATATRTVNVIDNVAPTITFGTNGSGTYSKTASSTITVTDQYGTIDTSSLKYLWNTSTIAPTEASFSLLYTSGSSVTIPAYSTGMYYLWAMAKDNSGNTTIIKTNAFYLDNTAPTVPTVNLNGYTSGTWTSSNITFTLSSTDANSGIYQYQYSVGGGAWTPTLGPNGWTYSWDANDSIVFRAVDNVGNASVATSAYVFRRDATSSVYTSYEIKNITSSGYDVYVYGVSDGLSGINRVQFPTWTNLNGQDDIQANWQTNSIATGVNQGNGTWYFRVNVSAHNNESGAYNTHFYIYDNAGNQIAYGIATLTVPPSVYYLVDVVNVGSFVSYTGNNGCSNCSGESVTCYGGYANTYSGWRVLTKSGSGASGTVTLVSAGTTMCIGSSTIDIVNNYGYRYLNTTYATGARSINCNDALPYTSAACTNYTTYVSDSMIQPGGFYYFATATSPGGSVLWAIVESGRFNTNAGYTFGLRPVITLKAGVIKTGGTGTSASPFTISI